MLTSISSSKLKVVFCFANSSQSDIVISDDSSKLKVDFCFANGSQSDIVISDDKIITDKS